MGVVHRRPQGSNQADDTARTLYPRESLTLATQAGRTDAEMVQELDRQNHTTILKDMLEQAKLGEKHKHLLELERTDIKDRIDTDVQEKTDGVF